MGVINQLSVEISNKIAAGEVVERPASVVKELVENAIDAGANVISVEIEKGGSSFIRVTDNGCGMTAEDATLCFCRHATSKIKTASDLDAIFTLGFRGEALSSIGAVSRIELITKRPQDSAGTKVVFAGGAVQEVIEAGAADGTTIVVRDLFYNTPARMKFLKKDATEAGYIADIMSRFILAHPEISFRLIRDSKEVYFTPGDSSLQNALYAVYGREYAKAVIDVDYEMSGIHVTGLAGKSETARANRSYQSFFVNRRYIKSAAITRAVEEAYKNQIMIGKFPTAILNIDIDPSSIDINVHPTKLEVKFSDDSQVYRAVYHAVKNALYSIPHIPEVERAPIPQPDEPEPILPKQATGWESAKTPVQRGGFAHYEHKPAFEPTVKKSEQKSYDFAQEESKIPSNSPSFDFKSKQPENSFDFITTKDSGNRFVVPSGDEYFRKKQEELAGVANAPLNELRSDTRAVNGIDAIPRSFYIIGQLFDTYILAEEGDSLLMIDQHAAHERLKYEELKAQLKERTVTPQLLIAPVPVALSPTETELYKEHKDDMLRLGFEAVFDKNGCSITTVPSPMDEDEMCSVFVELLTAFGENRSEVIDHAKERLTYTIACKAAIKANKRLSEIEMYELVRKVFKMENINTCPHGRPIIIKMTKKQIEKEFGRTL